MIKQKEEKIADPYLIRVDANKERIVDVIGIVEKDIETISLEIASASDKETKDKLRNLESLYRNLIFKEKTYFDEINKNLYFLSKNKDEKLLNHYRGNIESNCLQAFKKVENVIRYVKATKKTRLLSLDLSWPAIPHYDPAKP